MIYCLLVIVFFATVATGPAGRDLINQYVLVKRPPELVEGPQARVVYLPTAACRGEDERDISRGAWPNISIVE